MRISRRTRRPSRAQSAFSLRGLPRRSAVCVLELILWLPVFLIFLLAVIEFGLILGQLKQVALASRVGAKMAAESLPISMAAVQNEVDRQLESAGMGASCSIILVHNVPGGGASPQTTGGGCNCTSPTSPTLPTGTLLSDNVTHSGSVRVTVCVKLTQLTPNLLSTFGYSISNGTVQQTTTFVHEHP
jgi:Flp pilus assembly protein TadG